MNDHTCFHCEHGGNTPDEWADRGASLISAASAVTEQGEALPTDDPPCRQCGQRMLATWTCLSCRPFAPDLVTLPAALLDELMNATPTRHDQADRFYAAHRAIRAFRSASLSLSVPEETPR